MINDIFIGVDGGGTKSKLIMRDLGGRLLGSGRSGAANIRLSVDTSLRSIEEAFQQALAESKIDRHDKNYRFHIGLGLAGTEVPEACTEFLARLSYFDTVRLESDAVAACLGAHDGQDGAILIVGTGVIGYKIRSGEHKRVGGWGFPYDDVGGGAWFGMHAVRYTLEWCDGRREASPFLEAVYQSFHSSVTTLVSWADSANATDFATLAPVVTQYLSQGDRWAIELAERSGQALCAAADSLIKGDEMIPLCLFGGLASFMEAYLKSNLRLNIVTRKHDATEGSLIMVKNIYTTGAR
jgi:glucosamine kinase